jgi:hypothetical protein
MGAANKLIGKKNRGATAIILRGGVTKKPVNSKKQAAIQQLNDELAEDIIAASGGSDLVRLGIETIGIDQLTTFLPLKRGVLAQFTPVGYTEKELKEHRPTGYPTSPVDTTKPNVAYPIYNMVRRGLAGSRSDIGHEFVHAGILAAIPSTRLWSKQGREAVTRYHDMVTGDSQERATARAYLEERNWDLEKLKYFYDKLNRRAAKKLSKIGQGKIGQLMNE